MSHQNFVTHKRSPEGKRATLAHKARRVTKYAVRPLDVDAILSSLPTTHRGLRVA